MAELTLMAVHAHPDDESSSTGGVLAKYAAEGIRTVVVTCTNGEYGDGPGHVKPGEEGHDPALVAKTRLNELETALDVLGVAHSERLGYHDSGMPDWDHKDQEHVFCNVPVDEAAARLAQLFEQFRPQVVVTYDDLGGYNHPDHLQANYITLAAVERTNIPAKVYATAMARRGWEKVREIMAERGIEMPAPPARSEELMKRLAEVEQRITSSIDVRDVLHRKRAALQAHASQLDESWWLRFPDEAFEMIFATENFIRLHDTTGAPTPEDDLFAGLR